jgi:hypothetical protein
MQITGIFSEHACDAGFNQKHAVYRPLHKALLQGGLQASSQGRFAGLFEVRRMACRPLGELRGRWTLGELVVGTVATGNCRGVLCARPGKRDGGSTPGTNENKRSSDQALEQYT